MLACLAALPTRSAFLVLTQRIPPSTTTTHSARGEILTVAHSEYPHSSLTFLTPQQTWEEAEQVGERQIIVGSEMFLQLPSFCLQERLGEGASVMRLEPGQPLLHVAWKAGLRHHPLGEASRQAAASKISSFITMSCPKCRSQEITYGPNS